MKTKHYLFFISLLLLTLVTKAQTYYPFPTGDASWQVARCFYFYPPGWYDEHLIETTGEDTVINGKTYTKLFYTNHHAPGTDFDTIYPTVFIGGMREADKKIYFVSDYLCLDTFERCVYDFNATDVGESIYTQFLSPGSQVHVQHIVTGIDSVLIGSDYHRVLQLTDENFYTYEEWIEGMGSNYGLIYATFWMVTDNSYDLICFSENKVNEFLNPNPGFGFCQAPFPPVECDSLATGVHVLYEKKPLIYPNPVSSRIVIDASGKNTPDEFDLRDVSGRIVLSGMLSKSYDNKATISLNKLNDGIYLLTLYSHHLPITTCKVMKKE